jgi:uncharacterized protein with PQ loop repeat
VTTVDMLPVAAALFAIPQFVPQIRKLRRTGDTVGLSAAWALLTGISNAGWFCYFAASRYWFALVPSSSASLLGGALGVAIARRRPLPPRIRTLIGTWAIVVLGAALLDRRVLGAVLTAAFLVQVTPALAAVYRTRHPTGTSQATWLLILGEVSCWSVFGVVNGDGPLVVLGTTGVTSALAILHRSRSTARPGHRRKRGAMTPARPTLR